MARLVSEKADIIPQLGEVFREHGYEGASLALISCATGLGKGSLYHFFPGGKEEMAATVLTEIDGWFEHHIFAPLRATDRPRDMIEGMFTAVRDYFRSGQRICLVGLLGLGDSRDRFAVVIEDYFARWITALETALVRLGRAEHQAREQAEEVVAGIQGAIVLARALGSPATFSRTLARLRVRVLAG